MEKIINIIEENNHLKFAGEYEPIVCGNSIYSLKFQFSEVWASCNHKTAVFLIDGKYILTSFTGNVVSVPILPNAAHLSVSLLTGSGDQELATTALKINIKTTPAISNHIALDNFENYIQQIHSAINKIENGQVLVETANFAKNVIGKNLLINPEFKINQRGLTSLSTYGYFVDRWLFLGNGTITKNDNKIIVTTTSNSNLSQYLENDFRDFANKTLTLSAKINNKIYSTTGTVGGEEPTSTTGETIYFQTKVAENGINGYLKFVWHNVKKRFQAYFYFYGAQTNVRFEYFKLEVGSIATQFISRSYAEELAMCQRYFWKSSSELGSCYYGYSITPNSIRLVITMPSTMRTKPTISALDVSKIIVIGSGQHYSPTAYAYQEYSSNASVPQIAYDLTCANTLNEAYVIRMLQEFSLDAEIY